MFLPQACYGAFSRRTRFIAAVGYFALASVSLAQWPVSYQDPLVLGEGVYTRAGAIMSTPDGGIVVAFDRMNEGVSNLDTKRFDAAGTQAFSESTFSQEGFIVTRLEIRPPHFPDTSAGDISASWIRKNLDDTTGYIGATYTLSPVGRVAATVGFNSGEFLGFVKTDSDLQGDVRLYAESGYFDMDITRDEVQVPIEAGDHLKEFCIAASESYSCLVSYTRCGPQMDGNTAVMLTGVFLDAMGVVQLLGPYPAETEPNQQQGNSQLTRVGSGALMLSWITKERGSSSLNVKVVDPKGMELSPPQRAFNHLEDYVATSSTLGIPVFAAVQHDGLFYPPADRLVGGLINPSNGGTLTIPVAEGPDVKVKDLRQLDDGNFRLVYSILENGTNLLKVRCISGVSAATLWETTVADVGRASDETIEDYPNTFVAHAAGGVLYILSRYDQPGAPNCLFQVARLKSDGSMGSD